MEGIFNQKLCEVVRTLYNEIIAEFGPEEFNSEKFLSSFPYSFLHGENGDFCRRIADVAFPSELRQEAEKCIEACYSHHRGGDVPFYLADAVEDFLNYIIPRTIALPSSNEIFERYYRQFDSSIYGNSCLVTVFALLQDVWDHAGRGSVLPTGFRLSWLLKGPATLSIPYTRERAIPFFEIGKSAHALGRGRDLSGEHAFQVLQYSKSLPKNANLLDSVYSMMHEVVAKFLLATRITT